MYENEFVQDAQVTQTTRAGAILASMPTPKQQIPVVVYEFQDQTGQFKANDNFVEYSSAVTKGGLSVLVKALVDTSAGNFFMVAERGGLNNLIKERQIIRAMRSDYALPDGSKLPDLSPMIYGGVILEGGIVFYDTNVLTGGAAAGYFGISAATQYRRDIVTVYLRAVEVQTGKVLLAVNSSKTVFSYGVSGSLLRYLSVDRLLETEGGFSVNEPGQLAVRQAIETAVYSMIMEGALKNMWSFKDDAAGRQAVADYIARRDKATQQPPVVELDDEAAANSQENAEKAVAASTTQEGALDLGAAATQPAMKKRRANSDCNSFDAWIKRNFGGDEAPTVVKQTPAKQNWAQPSNAQ
jgi:curli production assembly/transport component CsgG